MQCVILAGGLATRMRPHTIARPKALLEVCGRPFADWQLSWLAAQRVRDVVYSIGHLGDQIVEHVGGGEKWGLRVRYVDEGDRRLGTGGALRLALDRGCLDAAFLVLYGDSYLDVDVSEIWTAFQASGRPALMTVFRNRGRWDLSNAAFADGVVTHYETDAPYGVGPSLEYIDYGLLVLTAQVVSSEIPAGTTADLAVVQRRLSRQGNLAGFEANHRFYEIGSPAGLAELETHLASGVSRPEMPRRGR
jgi:NDP-sugar pyrophosphorylase family protein